MEHQATAALVLGTDHGAPQPATTFIAGALNEISHHATQICVLRDLYAHHRP